MAVMELGEIITLLGSYYDTAKKIAKAAPEYVPPDEVGEYALFLTMKEAERRRKWQEK